MKSTIIISYFVLCIIKFSAQIFSKTRLIIVQYKNYMHNGMTDKKGHWLLVTHYLHTIKIKKKHLECLFLFFSLAVSPLDS